MSDIEGWRRCHNCDALRPFGRLGRDVRGRYRCLDAQACGRLRAARGLKDLEKFLAVSELRTRGLNGVGK